MIYLSFNFHFRSGWKLFTNSTVVSTLLESSSPQIRWSIRWIMEYVDKQSCLEENICLIIIYLLSISQWILLICRKLSFGPILQTGMGRLRPPHWLVPHQYFWPSVTPDQCSKNRRFDIHLVDLIQQSTNQFQNYSTVRGCLFSESGMQFFHCPNLKNKYSKKLSWAWNLNIPPITLYCYWREI